MADDINTEIADWSGYGGSGGSQVGLLGRIFGSDDASTVDRTGLTSAERRQPLWGALTHAGLLGLAAGGRMYDYQRAPLLAQMGQALGGIAPELQKAQTAASQRRLTAAQVPHLAAQTEQAKADALLKQNQVANIPLTNQKIQAEIQKLIAEGRYADAHSLLTKAQAGKATAETQEIERHGNNPEPPPVPVPGAPTAPAVTPPPVVMPPAATPPPAPTVQRDAAGNVILPPVPLPMPPAPTVEATGSSADPSDIKTVPQPLRLTPQTAEQMTGGPGAPAQVPLTPEQRTLTQPPVPTQTPPKPGEIPTVERQPGEPTYTAGPYAGMTQKQAQAFRRMPYAKAQEFKAKVLEQNTSITRPMWKEIRNDGQNITIQNAADGEIKVVHAPQTDAEKEAFLVMMQGNKQEHEEKMEAIKAGTADRHVATSELVKEAVKEHGKHTAAAEQAQSGLNTNAALGALLEDAYSGKYANNITDFVAALKGVGGMSSETLAKYGITDKLDVSQAARALSRQSALELRNPSSGAGMPGALSDSDRNYLESATPGLEMTPEGRKILLEMRNRLYQRSLKVHEISLDHMGSEGFVKQPLAAQRAIREYNKANPVFDQEFKDRVKALAGASAAPAPGTKAPTIIGVTPGRN